MNLPGHRVCALVFLPKLSVATVRLDELAQARNSQLYTVVAAQAPDGRYTLAGSSGARSGGGTWHWQAQTRNILFEHLALIPAELPGPLGRSVAHRKGGVTDGLDGQLCTAGRHVRGGGDH